MTVGGGGEGLDDSRGVFTLGRKGWVIILSGLVQIIITGCVTNLILRLI